MNIDAGTHRRRSIRLQGYDYFQAGAYFVTICTQNGECLFWDATGEEAQPGAAGKMIQTVWDAMPAYYPGVDVDKFVVMPNHIHGIIIVGADPCACPAPRACPELGQPQGVAPTRYKRLSLPDVVHRFKSMTTKRYADGVKQLGWPPFQGKLWQRNYWEHVIRDEADYLRICEYIQNNPAKWAQDRLNPSAYPENIGDGVGAGSRACPESGQSCGAGQPQGVAPTMNCDGVGAGPCACPEKEGE